MRSILIKSIPFLILIFIITGCGTTRRMARLKDRKENVIYLTLDGSIKEAKEAIGETCHQVGMIELKKIENENFMTCRGNIPHLIMSGGLLSVLFSDGWFGNNFPRYFNDYTRLGFFFDYNAEKNKTNIAIVEEVAEARRSKRDEFVTKLQFVSLKKLAQKQ